MLSCYIGPPSHLTAYHQRRRQRCKVSAPASRTQSYLAAAYVDLPEQPPATCHDLLVSMRW